MMKLTGDELERFHAFRRHRDTLAQRVGVATLELLALARKVEAEVEASLAVEGAWTAEILASRSLAPDTRVRIDPITGHIGIEGFSP